MSSDPILLFFYPTPNGFKISIMLEECGLSYRVEKVDIMKGEQRAPEFLEINPNNKIPAIIDPDGPEGKAIAIFESGAILQYLGRKTGKFYPQEDPQRIEVDEWLFWQVANLGAMGAQAHHYLKYAKEKVPYAIERFTLEMGRIYRVMNTRLEGRDYLAGEYSIADIASYGWIARWQDQGQNLDDFPNVKSWLARVGARPAVKRGTAFTA
jgi:GST-like protein